MKIRFDPAFTSFGLLNDFLGEFIAAQGLPPFYIVGDPSTHHGMVLTAAAGDCIHRHARLIAAELTKPEYQPEEEVEEDRPFTTDDDYMIEMAWFEERYGESGDQAVEEE